MSKESADVLIIIDFSQFEEINTAGKQKPSIDVAKKSGACAGGEFLYAGRRGRDVKGSVLEDVLMDAVTHLWHIFSGVPER